MSSDYVQKETHFPLSVLVFLFHCVFPCRPVRLLVSLSLCLSGWSDDSGPIVKSAIRYRASLRAGGVGGGGTGWWRDREGRGGWETEGIMGVLIARSMLSGAQGALAPSPALWFTCCSHSLVFSLYLPHTFKLLTIPSSTLCPSFASFSHLHTVHPPFFPQSPSLLLKTYGRVSDSIRKMIWSVSRPGMREQLVTFET